MRALLYARQSDTHDEGAGSLSLDSQLAVLRADAARLGWTIVAEVRDADLKGYDERRLGLLALYDRCRAGDVAIVAFWKLDRLARLLRLQENVLYELSQLGVDVWSNQDPHIGNPMFRQILGAFNEELTRIISANVRRAMRERAQRGLHHGPTPFGYHKTPEHRLVPSADAEIVRAIFQLRADGASWAELISELERRGVPSPTGLPRWQRTPLRLIIDSPVYRGAIRHRSTVIEGTHEAIVSDELWRRAQWRHGGWVRTRPPRAKDDGSWLEGLVRHGCGRAMYWWRPPAGDGRAFRLRCQSMDSGLVTCQVFPKSVRVPDLEASVWRILSRDVAGALAHDPARLIEDATERYVRDQPAAAAARREAEARVDRAATRRARAEDLYLSGARDRAWFDAEEARCAAELAETEAALARLPQPPDPDDLRRRLDALAALAGNLSDVTSREARTHLLRGLGTVVVDASGARVQYRPEYADFFVQVVVSG